MGRGTGCGAKKATSCRHAGSGLAPATAKPPQLEAHLGCAMGASEEPLAS